MYPSTELREFRLRHGLRLADVAVRAGLSLTRASRVERDLSVGTDLEISALRSAVELIAAEVKAAP
jgi:transcriptional regulator with XRE-family HTH domain